MKVYKLGKAIFLGTDTPGFYMWDNVTGKVFACEPELLEMGAQLVEEEKPQEIEKLSDHGAYFPSLKQILDKQNEIIEKFNTHPSECGKEKHDN